MGVEGLDQREMWETMDRTLSVKLDDLRAASVARARLLADPGLPMLDERQRATLAALGVEVDRHADGVLRAAADAERHPTEQAILYALVSTMRTMSETPHNPRLENTVNAQFVAARRQLRLLGRRRKRDSVAG